MTIMKSFRSGRVDTAGENPKMVLIYDATWWMFWNYFWDFFIIGLNEEKFLRGRIFKIKRISDVCPKNISTSFG